MRKSITLWAHRIHQIVNGKRFDLKAFVKSFLKCESHRNSLRHSHCLNGMIAFYVLQWDRFYRNFIYIYNLNPFFLCDRILYVRLMICTWTQKRNNIRANDKKWRRTTIIWMNESCHFSYISFNVHTNLNAIEYSASRSVIRGSRQTQNILFCFYYNELGMHTSTLVNARCVLARDTANAKKLE